MSVFDLYKKIIKDAGKTKREKFDNIFLIICLLIWNLSCEGKQLDKILELLNEFDFKKNFGKGE